MREPHALLAGMLGIMHPHLAEAANRLTDTLMESDVADAVRLWSSPFSALSVISNRESVAHRDTKSMRSMYDLLVTCGPYHNAYFNFHDLNIVALYQPGSVVALTGRLLRHSVGLAKESRLCYAYYFREAVFYRNGAMDPGLMTQAMYTPCMKYITDYLICPPLLYTGRF